MGTGRAAAIRSRRYDGRDFRREGDGNSSSANEFLPHLDRAGGDAGREELHRWRSLSEPDGLRAAGRDGDNQNDRRAADPLDLVRWRYCRARRARMRFAGAAASDPTGKRTGDRAGSRRGERVNWKRSAIAVLFAAPLVALLAWGFKRDPDAIPSPLPGKSAPTFALSVFSPGVPPRARPIGDTVRLANLRGRIVVLNFWASWCLVCRDEHATLTALAKRYEGRPVDF